jgi:hypothetical protein
MRNRGFDDEGGGHVGGAGGNANTRYKSSTGGGRSSGT